jgi:hypothetical protein
MLVGLSERAEALIVASNETLMRSEYVVHNQNEVTHESQPGIRLCTEYRHIEGQMRGGTALIIEAPPSFDEAGTLLRLPLWNVVNGKEWPGPSPNLRLRLLEYALEVSRGRVSVFNSLIGDVCQASLSGEPASDVMRGVINQTAAALRRTGSGFMVYKTVDATRFGRLERNSIAMIGDFATTHEHSGWHRARIALTAENVDRQVTLEAWFDRPEIDLRDGQIQTPERQLHRLGLDADGPHADRDLVTNVLRGVKDIPPQLESDTRAIERITGELRLNEEALTCLERAVGSVKAER